MLSPSILGVPWANMRQLPPMGKAESRSGEKSRIEASWLRIKKTKNPPMQTKCTDNCRPKKAV